MDSLRYFCVVNLKIVRGGERVDIYFLEKGAITLRTSISKNKSDWAGILYDGEDYYFSKSYYLHIVYSGDGSGSVQRQILISLG